MTPARIAALASALLLPTLLASGCTKEGCLDPSNAECVVPSPCPDLGEFTCANGTVSIKLVESMDEVPGGLGALGSIGDVRLANDKVVVIIDALDHPHYVAPTGGSILDFSTVGDDNDSLRLMLQATGVLPEEAAHYTEMKLIEEPGLVAVQLRGTLDGRPDMPIATRYELRPCEPGIRVRTELVNLEADPVSVSLFDASYFGDRGQAPFSPRQGAGFVHPSFGLSTLGDAIFATPYLVAAAASEPAASYATVACNRPELWGFESTNIAVNGMKARPLPYGDYEIFERFIVAAKGASVADAGNVALELRRRLFDETYVVLTGNVAVNGTEDVILEDGLRASVHVSEGAIGDDPAVRTPRSHARVATGGTFQIAVPSGRSYVLEVESYGRRSDPVAVTVEATNLDVGTLSIPAVGQVRISGTVNGVEDHLQVIVLPADDATAEATRAAMFGQFVACAPLLGAPYDSAPACNRVLLGPEGPQTVGILPGRYDFFAVAGPFTTLATARDVLVTAGATAQVDLAIQTLQVTPPDTLSGDFHVHGGASFDSNIPDDARVRAWLAARLEVLATTEHDTAWDYAEARDRLGADDRLRIMVGTESTGHILWKILPDSVYPQVTGHWNLWPIPFDPTAPYRGAPWDELVEPGQLFDRAVEQGWDPDTGIAQLNHPIEAALFARDQGYASMLGIDGTVPLPTEFDGTPPSSFLYTPPGASFANSDYHTQEVMNGTNNGHFPSYRAFWHYLLNQGILRGGMANSDSHTLTDNVVGTPRTLVFTDQTVVDFDPNPLNAALKEGRALGTNGPVIGLQATDVAGAGHGPSLLPFAPDETTDLRVRVTAAPWVPVEEVRVIVNGVVVKVFGIAELTHPADPLGVDGLLRLDAVVPLAELLPAGGEDAWLSVEAGQVLVEQADLDCDGFPDTGDNNGDGAIDWRDVEDLAEEPDEACLEDVGPQGRPADPARDADAYLFFAVTPGGFPLAFTNPLVFDRDGDGAFTGPGVSP